MSESYVDVKPIHPTTPRNSVHNKANAVRVNVSYSKGRGAELSAYPCERKDGIVSIIVTSGRSEVIEPMTRLNRKRIELLQSAMRNELSFRTGRAWGLVQELCQKYGYETITHAEQSS